MMNPPRHLDFRALALVLFLSLSAMLHAAQSGFYYTVQRGDSMTSISSKFKVSQSEITRANRLAPGARLAGGTKLWIPRNAPSNPSTASPSTSKPRSSRTPPAARSSGAGIIHTVRPGETLSGIAKQNGLSSATLARLNGLPVTARLEVGQRLRVAETRKPTAAPVDIPGGGVRVSDPPSPPASSSSSGASIKPSRSGFIWPVEGRVIRRFTNVADKKFTGIDIKTPRGTEVRAANDGRVVYTGDSMPGYGRMVIIDHAAGLATCYGQNDQILVSKGQQVRRGQVIARSGNTGTGGEAYLHFEVRRNGEAVNPESHLP